MTDAERAELQQWRDDAATMRELQSSAMWEVYAKHLTLAINDSMTRVFSADYDADSEKTHWLAVVKTFKNSLDLPKNIIDEAQRLEDLTRR